MRKREGSICDATDANRWLSLAHPSHQLLFFFILLCLFAPGAGAKKLYKYQEKDGTWHFTDKAPSTAVDVSVRQMAVAPRQMVWLNQLGEERHPRYTLRNDYTGPVEVAVELTEQQNTRSNPELPRRFTVPPGESDSLFAMVIIDESQPSGFTIKYSYVLGEPLANYRSEEPYYPPLETNASFQITQAFGGSFSHQDEQNRYAVDIAMPEGTPVHAARSGLVMEVENDFFKGGTQKAYVNEANSIRILHDDGSMAVYAHLALEKAQVQEGMEVKTGQLIGYSGNTGFSTGPHLHFAVQYNQGMKLMSVPFQFINRNGEAEDPEVGTMLQGLAIAGR